jgi:hypothetical protein
MYCCGNKITLAQMIITVCVLHEELFLYMCGCVVNTVWYSVFILFNRSSYLFFYVWFLHLNTLLLLLTKLISTLNE